MFPLVIGPICGVFGFIFHYLDFYGITCVSFYLAIAFVAGSFLLGELGEYITQVFA
jgi:hypothetical protein